MDMNSVLNFNYYSHVGVQSGFCAREFNVLLEKGTWLEVTRGHGQPGKSQVRELGGDLFTCQSVLEKVYLMVTKCS